MRILSKTLKAASAIVLLNTLSLAGLASTSLEDRREKLELGLQESLPLIEKIWTSPKLSWAYSLEQSGAQSSFSELSAENRFVKQAFTQSHRELLSKSISFEMVTLDHLNSRQLEKIELFLNRVNSFAVENFHVESYGVRTELGAFNRPGAPNNYHLFLPRTESIEALRLAKISLFDKLIEGSLAKDPSARAVEAGVNYMIQKGIVPTEFTIQEAFANWQRATQRMASNIRTNIYSGDYAEANLERADFKRALSLGKLLLKNIEDGYSSKKLIEIQVEEALKQIFVKVDRKSGSNYLIRNAFLVDYKYEANGLKELIEALLDLASYSQKASIKEILQGIARTYLQHNINLGEARTLSFNKSKLAEFAYRSNSNAAINLIKKIHGSPKSSKLSSVYTNHLSVPKDLVVEFAINQFSEKDASRLKSELGLPMLCSKIKM